jgi:transcription elongation GreA/GreB family factor
LEQPALSVAFRRESDDEHLEPRFELPIPPGPNLVTARGLRLIEVRVAELETALQASTEEEARKPIARDLRYWRTRRATAELTSPVPGDEVAFGRRVRVRMGERERVLEIVGHDEADPARDRLAYTAPLARALLGGVAGDVIAFAGREAAIEILDIIEPAVD